MTRFASARAVLAIALIAAAAAAPAAAQSVRVHSTTTVRYVQLRPIRYDADSGRYVPQAVQSAAPAVQDLEVNVWGLGVAGLRGYGLLRLRGSLGSDLVWPRYGDHFDALALYLEYERADYRLRLGRQHKASALGWYGYDGLSAAWRVLPRLRVEGYAGRGLARGYLEPVNSSTLQSLDAFGPDKGSLLVGASVWAAPTRASTVSAIYQREVLSDWSGLVSERAALDASLALGSSLLLDGSTDVDIGAGEWGKARIGALYRLGRRGSLRGELFRYRPTLDLTTIWGVFSPESHWGYAATARYTPSRDASLWAGYTRRVYRPAEAPNPLATALPDRAQEIALGAHLGMGDFRLEGSYRAQLDFGGAQSGGDVSLSRAPLGGWRVGVRATAFQREGEFRVSDGTVYGIGATARGRVAGRFDLRADLMRLFHRRQERVPAGQTGLDWSQTRGSVAIEWTFGSNADRQGAYR